MEFPKKIEKRSPTELGRSLKEKDLALLQKLKEKMSAEERKEKEKHKENPVNALINLYLELTKAKMAKEELEKLEKKRVISSDSGKEEAKKVTEKSIEEINGKIAAILNDHPELKELSSALAEILLPLARFPPFLLHLERACKRATQKGYLKALSKQEGRHPQELIKVGVVIGDRIYLPTDKLFANEIIETLKVFNEKIIKKYDEELKERFIKAREGTAPLEKLVNREFQEGDTFCVLISDYITDKKEKFFCRGWIKVSIEGGNMKVEATDGNVGAILQVKEGDTITSSDPRWKEILNAAKRTLKREQKA